jgi:glucosyl-3-phosphoglycerate phosphatase
MTAVDGGGRRTIVVWRHGRTQWNTEHRFQGHSDIALDELGLAQAERAARLLASFPPDVVICSDLSRARQTVAPLLTLTGLPATYDPALRETNGGSWEGLLDVDILARDGEAYRAWKRGEDIAAGGGERRTETAARVVAAVEKALADVAAGQVLVVVTHGGTARGMLGRMLDLPVSRWRALGGLANCSWSVLEETRWGWRLAEHNAGTLPEPVMGDDV